MSDLNSLPDFGANKKAATPVRNPPIKNPVKKWPYLLSVPSIIHPSFRQLPDKLTPFTFMIVIGLAVCQGGDYKPGKGSPSLFLSDLFQGIPVGGLFRGVEFYRFQDKFLRLIEVLPPGAIKPCQIVIGIGLLRILFDGLFIVGFRVRPFFFLEMGISKIKIGDPKFFGGHS